MKIAHILAVSIISLALTVFHVRCQQFQASPQFGPRAGAREDLDSYVAARTDALGSWKVPNCAMDGDGTALSWESAWTLLLPRRDGQRKIARPLLLKKNQKSVGVVC